MKISEYVSSQCCIIGTKKLSYYNSICDFDYVVISETEVVVLGGVFNDIPMDKIGYISRRPERTAKTIKLQEGYYAIFPSCRVDGDIVYSNTEYISPLELVFDSEVELIEASTVCSKLGIPHTINNTSNKRISILLETYKDLNKYKEYVSKDDTPRIQQAFKRNREEFEL